MVTFVHMIECDVCHAVEAFDTPILRSRWATDHVKKTGHRPRAYDEVCYDPSTTVVREA